MRIGKAAAAVVFSALGVVWTWPLIRDLSVVVPGIGPGDNLMFFWNFWWFRHALATHHDVFNTTMLFAPVGVPLTLQTLTPLPAAIGATLLSPLSTAAALNVTIVASLALNGFCAHLLAFRICGDRAAAIMGGLFFAGSSFVAGHLHGHFNLTSAFTVPLFAMTLMEALRGSRLWAVVAGAVFAATVYIDYYYLIFEAALAVVIVATTTHQWTIRLRGPGNNRAVRNTVATLALAALVVIAIVSTGGFTLELAGRAVSIRTIFNPLQVFWLLAMAWAWLRFRPRLVRDRIAGVPNFAATAFIVASVFAVLAMPLILNAVSVVASGNYVTQTYFWRSAPSGIDLATIVMGPPFHGIAGGLVRSAYAPLRIDPIEANAWLGIVPLLLVVTAFRRVPDSPAVRQWTVIGAVFFLWSLGPHLYVFGKNTGMILPGTVLRYIPIVNNARIPGRAMVVVTLAIAMIAAVGAARWRLTGRRAGFALAALTCAFILESIPAPFPMTTLSTPALYETVRDRPEPGAVLELPLGMHDGFGGRGQKSALAMYFQSVHQRPLIGGYLARLPPSIALAYAGDTLLDGLLRLSDGGNTVLTRALPDARAAGERLHANSIAFVVLNRGTASQKLIEYVESTLPLTLIVNEGERSLYLVR